MVKKLSAGTDYNVRITHFSYIQQQIKKRNDQERRANIYSQIIAPLPPQFLHTGLSFPSIEVALDSETELPMFTKAIVEHKQVIHCRREVNNSSLCFADRNIYLN